MLNIAQNIVQLAVDNKLLLTTAESITGGAVATELTAVPGASQVFLGGYVVYTSQAKQLMLGVQPSLIAQFGTVSAECAQAMALGALDKFSAEQGVETNCSIISLATTGNAGPTVDSAGSTVGQVYIAVAVSSGSAKTTEKVVVGEHSLTGTRADIRQQTTRLALELLLEACQ